MENLIHRLELSARMLENSHKPYLAQYIGSQLKTLRRIQEGAPYLLCTYYFPPELLQLFDIEALYIERIVGLTVSTGLYTESSDALPETILLLSERLRLAGGKENPAQAPLLIGYGVSLPRCSEADGISAGDISDSAGQDYPGKYAAGFTAGGGFPAFPL